MKKEYIIKETVKHQGIGGKIFYPLELLTAKKVDKEAMSGNIACFNFILRRQDINIDSRKDLYYGKVEVKPNIYLGYVLCEDELEEVI